MSVNGGPDIIEQGLVLYLDAQNSKSYAGTGITWNSLVRGITGSLVNGPTFSTSNNGIITFDGIDDYARTNALPLTGNETLLTLACWFRPANVSTIVSIMTIGNDVNGARRMLLQRDSRLEANGQFADVTSTNSVLTVGAWVYLTVVYTSLTLSTGVTLYVNGNSVPSSVTNGSSMISFTNTACTVAGTNTTPPTNGVQGSIGSVYIYNRALSAAEVQQNFNVTRRRFGV